MDQIKCFELEQEAANIYKVIQEQTNKLNDITAQIKSLLPKGYWYTCDIDRSWRRPKKYSVKYVEYSSSSIYVTVKEVFKKKPWPSFTGEHLYRLDDFLKLAIYKTEKEAMDAYIHRICPKCGGYMMYSENTWCIKCMDERRRIKQEFESTHSFYSTEKMSVYTVGYTDELTREKGFEGKHFVIKRLDTGEIFKTDNLWVSYGKNGNVNNLPEIEFIEGVPYG